MRIQDITCLIAPSEDIAFRLDSAEMYIWESGMYIDLEGEYLQNNLPLNPPLKYKMIYAPRPCKDLVQILIDKYHSIKTFSEIFKNKL